MKTPAAKTITIAVTAAKRPVESVSHTETKDRYEFTAVEVLYALRMANLLPDALGRFDQERYTEEVEAFVRVPGGGDWSNTNLDLAVDCPLVVTIKRESRD